MIPILYNAEYLPHSKTAIGKLPGWRELKVIEERNGEFCLEGDLAVGSLNADKVGVEMVIRCAVAPDRPNYDSLQPFRVKQVTKSMDDDTIHVVANHISYQLREYIISPSFSYADTSVQDILDELNNPSNGYITPSQGLFGFHSTIVTSSPIQPEPDDPLTVRAWLGSDDENSLASCLKRAGYDVEFEWDGFDCRINQNRGVAYDHSVAYGRNMLTLAFDADTAELVTGYYGWYRGNGYFKHAVAYRVGHGNFAYERIAAVDFSNEFETVPTDTQMQEAVSAFADAQGTVQLPTSITVTAVPDTLQDIHLCDYVTVIHPGYGLKNLSKVVKVEYDPIHERYQTLTIGEIQTGITDTVARMLEGRAKVASLRV